MSKKVKRQTTKSSPANGTAYVTADTAAIANSVRTTRSPERDFNPDYSHTIQDLKRVGVIAGSFLVILIALSFFL